VADANDSYSTGRVLIAGDTHGDKNAVRYLLSVASDRGCSRIVQVGDFGYWPHKWGFHEWVDDQADDAGVRFYWLDGNHENFDALEANGFDLTGPEPQRMGDALWYCGRGATWQWEGVRFMSFGGAYSIDKEYRTPGSSWWEQELPTQPQVLAAMERGPVDILLTHDAPEGVVPIVDRSYKGDEISRGNRLAITALMEAVTPRLLVHGHYHHRYSARSGRTQVEGLGRDGDRESSFLILDIADWRRTSAA
jgi:hypothetical protein